MDEEQGQNELASARKEPGMPEEFDGSHFVDCDYCETELELSDEELAQGWYICPECDHLSHLADTYGETAEPVFQIPGSDDNVKWVKVAKIVGVEEAALEVSYLRTNGIEAFAWQKGGQAFDLTGGGIGAFYVMVRKDQEQKALSIRGNLVECERCRESLILSDPEVTQEWFVCPLCQGTCYLSDTVTCLYCGSQSYLKEAEREQGWYRCSECDRLIPMTLFSKLVNCGHCDGVLELSDQEVIQGWFICPACHEMGYLGGPVTCLSCGNRKDLDKAEWQQGWYRCPGCEQITHLVDEFTEVANTTPESLDQVPDDDWIQLYADWVQLKQVATADEAAQLVQFLHTGGIEAFTRRGRGKGAFGLAIDTLSTYDVMVQESQRQLAVVLLEAEAEEDQHSHPGDDWTLPDTPEVAADRRGKDR